MKNVSIEIRNGNIYLNGNPLLKKEQIKSLWKYNKKLGHYRKVSLKEFTKELGLQIFESKKKDFKMNLRKLRGKVM